MTWCRKHGDVTACPCRPVPKKYRPAIATNWIHETHHAKVTSTSRNGARVTLVAVK